MVRRHAALAEASEVLYGERWQSDLARALGISDPRQLREWMSGTRRIPPGVWAGISALSCPGQLESCLLYTSDAADEL